MTMRVPKEVSLYRSDIASDDRKVEGLQNLMCHAALFLLVNIVAVGIDLVDGARGDTVLGLDWAYWLLIPWTALVYLMVWALKKHQKKMTL